MFYSAVMTHEMQLFLKKNSNVFKCLSSKQNDHTTGMPENGSVCLKEILDFYFYLFFTGPSRKKLKFSYSLSLRGRIENNDKERFWLKKKKSLPKAK